LSSLFTIFLMYSCNKSGIIFEKSWSNLDDRVWVGPEFWANRLQDWKVQDGRLECVANNPRLLMRTVHLINCRIDNNWGKLKVSLDTGPLQAEQNADAACGILIGAGPRLDVWGASLVQQKPGQGAGIFAGINASGTIFIRDMENDEILSEGEIPSKDVYKILLELIPEEEGYTLTLQCGEKRLSLKDIVNNTYGNIALVSHPGDGDKPGTFWFNNIKIAGNKLKWFKHTVGPIIAAQHTLSDGVLKMTAQMTPVSSTDPGEVFLEISKDGTWKEIAQASIITPGYTATFTVTDWDTGNDIPYRVKYSYYSSQGNIKTVYYEGIVRHDPVEKEEIVIAGFTGNHNISHPGLSGTTGTFNYDSSGIWYPHKDIVAGVKKNDPDFLFFSGDQVYEGDSPTFPDRDHYELDYLYKWYLYCLAYRELTRNIPTVSVPDDHDVYQGNLWGQNGRTTDVDNKGGYVHPAWFIKMIERTQCSNLPDPYDSTPIEQGIGVYYTSIKYGGIGFAVLEDRKFKSGCSDNPFITRDRPDHVIDPQFDTRKIDLPGKKLLGDRQLKFLNDWATDWDSQYMKIALSQTVFANVATHHGSNLVRLMADLDSNGWPQTGRNKAIDALRKAFAFHLAGDQHLASVVHHGVDDWDDGIFSFCVPSAANFYPRAWWPEDINGNEVKNTPDKPVSHLDGFGNYMTVFAVTNPTSITGESTGKEPLGLHDKMPGYGIVKMNKKERTIRIECWPRWADPLIDQPYEGWPVTISQFDNYGLNGAVDLPLIKVEGSIDPVVEIRNESNGELVNCVRIRGQEYRPKVIGPGPFTVIVNDQAKNLKKNLENMVPGKSEGPVVVKF